MSTQYVLLWITSLLAHLMPPTRLLVIPELWSGAVKCPRTLVDYNCIKLTSLSIPLISCLDGANRACYLIEEPKTLPRG